MPRDKTMVKMRTPKRPILKARLEDMMDIMRGVIGGERGRGLT